MQTKKYIDNTSILKIQKKMEIFPWPWLKPDKWTWWWPWLKPDKWTWWWPWLKPDKSWLNLYASTRSCILPNIIRLIRKR
jgi:hypothetical protein